MPNCRTPKHFFLVLIASCLFSATTTALPSQYALNFTASPDSYVQLATNNLPSGASPRTVSFWSLILNQTEFFFENQAGIVGWGQGTCDGTEFSVDVSNDPSLPNPQNLSILYGACNVVAVAGQPSSNFGNWFHTAATYDGATLSLYLNGALIAQDSATLDTATQYFFFGQRSSGLTSTGFVGLLDEVRIWNRSLCSTEVQNDIYSEPASSGLVGWWTMQTDSQGMLIDESGSGNNGVLNGDVSVEQLEESALQVTLDGVSPVTSVSCGSGVSGDPQFTGFMGQDFQVHGASNTIYNVLSTPTFQYNALFRYLESGRARKGTQAFSHPGNYFGAVGVQIKDSNGKVHELLIQSGPFDTGLTLFINNQTMSVSEHEHIVGAYAVSLPNQFEVVFESDEFNIRVQNSDMFLNQDVSIGSGLMMMIARHKQAVKAGDVGLVTQLKAELPHGILGQTWGTITYNNRWKHIEGQLFDYAVADGLMGEEFKYNKF